MIIRFIKRKLAKKKYIHLGETLKETIRLLESTRQGWEKYRDSLDYEPHIMDVERNIDELKKTISDFVSIRRQILEIAMSL